MHKRKASYHGPVSYSTIENRYIAVCSLDSVRGQAVIMHVTCPGERRVRIDVHDNLDNYGVFEVDAPRSDDGKLLWRRGVVYAEQLKNWKIDYT